MIGVALNTLLAAVSPTARKAAFLLLPKDSGSLVSPSFLGKKTSIPDRISPPLIRKTLTTPADATAAKGTSRVRTILVDGLTLFSRGTIALRPSATPQDAATAMPNEVARSLFVSGEDLLAFDVLMATLRD